MPSHLYAKFDDLASQSDAAKEWLPWLTFNSYAVKLYAPCLQLVKAEDKHCIRSQVKVVCHREARQWASPALIFFINLSISWRYPIPLGELYRAM